MYDVKMKDVICSIKVSVADSNNVGTSMFVTANRCLSLWKQATCSDSIGPDSWGEIIVNQRMINVTNTVYHSFKQSQQYLNSVTR